MAKKEHRMTQGMLSTMANAYEPSYTTLSSPFNTQATRDVAAGKSGIVGNTKAGDKVYNPKTKVRAKIAQKIAKRNKAFKKEKPRSAKPAIKR